LLWLLQVIELNYLSAADAAKIMNNQYNKNQYQNFDEKVYPGISLFASSFADAPLQFLPEFAVRH
jgi:hypothetical protein